jgi:serine protease Do
MFGKLKQSFSNRSYGLRSLTAVAFSFLVAGVVMATGFNWTGSSGAQSGVAAQPVSAQPVIAQAPGAGGSFATLAEKLTPSVVNVKVAKIENAGMQWPEGHGRSPGRGMGPDDPFGEFFGRFFGDGRGFPGNPGNQLVQGAGSGVVISGDGTILTNNHVVEGAKEVKVTLADQREFNAKVVGRDPKTDLAVLKINAGKDLPAAPMGDSDDLKVGDWVLAIGNPFGLSETVTSGIVSAKGRVIGAGPYDDFIQTDASINPGNSGGPLFNMNGEVVGINTAIVPDGQGIGFAIPINTAKPLIPQLVSKGKVTRGYIGVNIQNITPEIAAALKIDDRKGALVADVVAGSPADKAGVKRGDVILSYNGKEVKDSHDLPALVASTPVGDEAVVKVLRDGGEKMLHVKIGKLGSDRAGADLDESEEADLSRGKLGLALQDVTPKLARRFGLKVDHGALVTDVQPGSPSDQAGIREGDVIVEVNHHQVESVEEVREEVAGTGDKGPVLLLVQRDRGKIYIALKN